MPENKFNSVLYRVLAAVVLLYFHIIILPDIQVTQEKYELPCGEVITSDRLYTEECPVGGQKAGQASEDKLPGCISEDGLGEDSVFGERLPGSISEDKFKEDASSVIFQGKDETAERNINPTGYHLYIDLDRTQLFVYKDGMLIKTYEVSGGKPSSPSPEGTWKIISKDTWGEGFGGAWLGFNVPWGMYGIHGTTEPWSVGRSNTSKGCIRMRNADVRELYKLVPYHTVVTIVHKNRPFYPMRDGDVGNDVLEIERALKKLGYYYGSEDGIYGEALKIAVREFQKDNRLYQTGVVNSSTYELIMKKSKELE